MRLRLVAVLVVGGFGLDGFSAATGWVAPWAAEPRVVHVEYVD